MKTILIKKWFLGKATGHNDNYMMNVGGQRPKFDSNWLLASPYLQHWKHHYASADFQKSMYEKSQAIIQKRYEKS